MNKATHKLSRQQKFQLIWLYHMVLRVKAREQFGQAVHPYDAGISTWHKKHANDPNDPFTRSEVASRSRTWRRLEQRGLVRRWADVRQGGRITHVYMTDAGEAAALEVIEQHATSTWVQVLLNGCHSQYPKVVTVSKDRIDEKKIAALLREAALAGGGTWR